MNPRARARDAGFTLVEIMVVVLIISVLATLAVPTVATLQRRARTTAIQNDFRVFGAAFDTYAQEYGTWPADSAPGVVPPEMAGRLNAAAFTRKSPMGGQYNWESNQTHYGVKYRAALTIKATASAPMPLDVQQYLDLEHHIDGPNVDWFGGQFRIGTGIVPLFVIQQ